MRILLIDDEQAILEVFTQTLQTAQFNVITAVNGKDGFEKAKLEKPDAILLDQILPDMNGNQILQMLKSDPITQKIPVAILSNYNQDSMMQQALSLGANDYMLKYQITPQELVVKVKNMLPNGPVLLDENFETQPTINHVMASVSAIPPAPLTTHQQITNFTN